MLGPRRIKSRPLCRARTLDRASKARVTVVIRVLTLELTSGLLFQRK